MVGLRILPSVIVLAAISAACLPCGAQTADDSSAVPGAKPVPERAVPVPFSIDTPEAAFAIQVRSPGQMTEADRMLEADAESSIAERAGFDDLAFNEGKWSYTQLVCPALPNHLFLRFTRNNGEGDVSVFSASIPRNSEGHVRIIPIIRRSYSLFSPAPINALTIAAFNHIRVEERSEDKPGWLGTGLCYAALAGADPVTVGTAPITGKGKFPSSSPAIMEIPVDGGAVIRFTDASAKPHPMVWELTFNPKGRLLKAGHARADISEQHVVPADDSAQQFKRVPVS
jgi:hypothetical protein